MIDRLMLNREGKYSLNSLEDFPPNKFIVAIKKGHTGHASQAAPLRALITYWLGTVYGNKWLLNYSQIYGIPMRWATTSETDNTAKAVIGNMLKKIGSAGWGVFSSGTKLEIKESSTSAGSLPQQALIDNASKAVDIFILGQTLTSDVGSSGSQALGNVHNEIRLDVVDRVGNYAAKVISGDLVTPMLVLNYGDDSDMPKIIIRSKRSKDAKGLAETDEILMRTFPELERSEEQIRERHDIAKPMNEEDKVIGVTPTEEPPAEEVEETEEEVEASQATIKAAEAKANIDKLADNVLESLTDVAAEWLSGVKPAFVRLAALADSDNATDEDFLNAVIQAKNQLPELFDKLDTEALQKAFAESSGTAMMAGVEDNLGV
jgi:phage gp29-like protein